MTSNVLVLNSGSSSVKYRLFRSDRIEDGHPLASDVIQRIGEPDSPIQDHRQAIRQIVQRLEDEGCLGAGELRAVGHRVVHGGEAFDRAVVVDEPVLDAIRRAVVLAPLHNPANLLGIEACRQQWPAVPQVAVFDTAFHQTLPEAAFRYAIPSAAYREHGIRRYGFHGTSFAYITRYLAEHWGRPRAELNLIVLHLGNGASACAIRNGRSINTSMGMTPLAGLMMGTRCGDIDPGVLLYWQEQLGAGAAEVSCWLNRDSGLKGIAGTNDMRDVLAASGADPAADLALAMYAHRLRHYIGAYRAQLPQLDALVFTGGIGEHAAPVREHACRGLEHLGFCLDADANRHPPAGVAEIQAMESPVRILIVPTDEEAEIARQSLEALESHRRKT